MRPPLPTMLLANICSLENKMDELRTRIAIQCEIRECCALIITETWLSDKVPDSALLLLTHTQFTKETTHRPRGRPEEVVSACMLTTGGVWMCGFLESTVLWTLNF